MKLIVVGLAGALAMAACATPQTRGPTVAASAVADEAVAQQRFMIETRIAERVRVNRVHRRLSVANIEFCKLTTPSIGVGLHALSRYGRRFKDAAKNYGIAEAATIAYVLEDTPAARAGVRAGDTIVAINAEAIPPGPQALRRAERELRDLKLDVPARIQIKRGAETLDVEVQPEAACGFPVQIAESDEVNAYADGKVVVIPRGMLRFVQNDDELALIVGHELAHNAMGHLDARMQNQMVGMAGGLVLDVLLAATTGYASDTFSRAGAQAGALAYSKAFENEADYAGLYFMTRAGFNTDNVENFWRRMAADSPQAIFVGQSHPTTPERFVSIAQAREEIRAKQAAQVALRPRMKGDAPEAALAASAAAAPVTVAEAAPAATVSAQPVTDAPPAVPTEAVAPIEPAATTEPVAPTTTP